MRRAAIYDSGNNLIERFHPRWRRGGLMVSALYSGSSVPGSNPGWGHPVALFGQTLDSHGASLHPGVYMGTGDLLCWG